MILGSLAAPVSVSFLRTQGIDETALGVLDTLRRAHSQAFFQKHDSDFGVRFLPNSYVLFEGGSYATRIEAQDETFAVPINVEMSGATEVVFEKRSGVANPNGSVTITSGNASTTISVSSLGLVERE